MRRHCGKHPIIAKGINSMLDNTATLKQHLRSKIRHARNLLSVSEQKLAAENLKKIISTLEFFSQAKTISGYLAFDGEIDLKPVLDFAISNKKQCYLPILDKPAIAKGRDLFFAPFTHSTSLVANSLGIYEPNLHKTSYTQLICPHNLDLILIPLVAFDRSGNRLGIGGGYFDAALKKLLVTNNLQHRPKLIGIAHSLQEVASVPIDDWDIPLDAIVTNNEFIVPRSIRICYP